MHRLFILLIGIAISQLSFADSILVRKTAVVSVPIGNLPFNAKNVVDGIREFATSKCADATQSMVYIQGVSESQKGERGRRLALAKANLVREYFFTTRGFTNRVFVVVDSAHTESLRRSGLSEIISKTRDPVFVEIVC